MSKGRTIASSVTLVLLIGLSSACGGSSKSYTAAQNELTRKERAAEAAEAKAAARKQAAALRKEAEAQRKAAIATRLSENRRRALEASTSTTTTPKPTSTTTPTSVAPTTPTSVAPPPATTPPTDPPAVSAPDDLTSIQDALEDLNAAFRASVAAGITHSESVNYWVSTGVYTGRQCAAFEARQGGGVIRESLSVKPGSVQADPGWIDPVVGSKPGGRVYRLVATNVQTLVTTGEQRTVSVPLHVTVRPDGQVLLFLRCK